MSVASSMYQDAMKTREKMLSYKETVRIEEKLYKEKIEAYRIESVSRVLDFVRNEYRAGRLCDLEILLCHCQNKLHGNIDGTELNLEERHKGVSFVTEDEQALKQMGE